MKIRTLALAGAAALALAGAASASDATGWYVGLGGGWGNQANIKIDLKGTTTGRASLPPKNSAVIVGDVGYRFANRIRLATEVSYTHHGYKGDVYGGHDNITGVMFDAFYDVPLSPKWDFTFGGGLGIGHTGLKARDGGITLASGSKTDFMLQGVVGLAYSITDRLDAYVDYRYRSILTGGNHYGTSYAGTIGDLNNTNGSLVMAGLRFYFASPKLAPPPPPPVVAAPPPPQSPPPVAAPPPVKTFIVFFDLDKSELDERAVEVVTDAVDSAKTNGFTKVKVVGYTDTVGKPGYNLKLSVARSKAIKAEMVRQGLAANGITIEGKGFSELLVKTGPDVQERQNRRGTIELDK